MPNRNRSDGVLADPTNHDPITILEALDELDDKEIEAWLHDHPETAKRVAEHVAEVYEALADFHEKLAFYGWDVQGDIREP